MEGGKGEGGEWETGTVLFFIDIIYIYFFQPNCECWYPDADCHLFYELFIHVDGRLCVEGGRGGGMRGRGEY